MNNIFDIVGGNVTLSNWALAIPAFKKIWESNKDKDYAKKVISYIVFMNHPSSPYVESMYEEDRKKKLIDEIFNGKWSPTENDIYAEKMYIDFMDTLPLKMLRGIRVGLEHSSKYLLSMEYENMTMKTVNEILDMSSKVDKSIKSIDSLEKRVKKDELDNSRVRGGNEIGIFEIPKKNYG